MDNTVSEPTSGLLLGLVLALASAVVYYHIKVFSFWSSRGVPGPRPWPIFGTDIYYLLGNKVYVDLEWRKRYGPTYGIYEGYWPTLRTTDDEILRQVYIKQFDSFNSRNTRNIHGDNIRRWMLWADGPTWQNQRPLISPMFTSNKMRSMFPTMSRCIDSFLAEAHRRHAESKSSYFKHDVMALTLDVIASSFFSLKLDTYRDRANEFLRRAFDFARFDKSRLLVFVLTPKFLARWLKFDLTPHDRYIYFDKLSQSIIDERRRATKQMVNGQVKKPNDFIQALMDARIPDKYERVFSMEDDKDAHYNSQMGHEDMEQLNEAQTRKAGFRQFEDLEIRGQMTFLFIAGFDATATALGFCLYQLAHQPKEQEIVYQELRDKFKPDQADHSDLMELRQLDAFISEALRLHSPIIENNRTVTAKEGVVLGGKQPLKLPRGTVISTNFYVLMRDPKHFERPDEFDLTRFYPENRSKIKTCTYMPFGAGPRYCAGMRFALLEIRLFLAKLLLEFSVSPDAKSESHPPEYLPHAFFLQFKHTGFVLTPR